MNTPNFTEISAHLLNEYKPQIIRLLQDNGVLISSAASDSQVRKAYLMSIVDSASFRKSLTNFIYNNDGKSADGLTYGANLSNPYGLPSVDNPLANATPPNLSFLNSPATGVVNPAANAQTTSGGGFFKSLGKILSSPQFTTILDTAANAYNTNMALKEQDKQIQSQQLQYANTAQLLNSGYSPYGTQKTGLSAGAKIGIFVGVIIVIAGVIIAINHSNKNKPGQVRILKSAHEPKLLR